MADGLPSVLVENAELVGTIATIISLFLYRHLKGQWPLLSDLRRKTLPFLHEVIMQPAGGYAAREQYDREFVGTYDIGLGELHKKFRAAKNIYPNNFAAIKYMDKINDVGEVVRHYESSSWAHREGGLTGDTQTHFMVYENNDGTISIYAHYEHNPIPSPVMHYEGDGDTWDIQKGVENAIDIMDRLEVPKSDVQSRL